MWIDIGEFEIEESLRLKWDIPSLAADIQEKGLLEVLRGEVRDGKYVITDGARRLKALRTLGYTRLTISMLDRVRFYAHVENPFGDDV